MVVNLIEKPDAELEEALGELRISGKKGRTLAKAYKKLAEGKIKSHQLMIGIMAATLQVAAKPLLKPLLGFWADQTKDRLSFA